MTWSISPFHSMARSTSPESNRSCPLSGANTLMFGFCFINSCSAWVIIFGSVVFSGCPMYLKAAPSTSPASLKSAIFPRYFDESSSHLQLSGVPSTFDFL